MKKPKYWSLAKKTLSKKDKVIKKIIATHSGSLVSRSDPFFSLCRSIIGQQISVQSADSVWNRHDFFPPGAEDSPTITWKRVGNCSDWAK